MDSKNLYAALEAAPLDPAVGIRLAGLSGGEGCALFAAEIAPGTRLRALFACSPFHVTTDRTVLP